MKTILTIILLLVINFSLFGQTISQSLSSDKRYALVIGISKYKNSANDLKFAHKDATDFRDALYKYGRFESNNVRLLVDKDASRENIRKNIEGWLKSKVTKNDLVIIFFSGHGTQVPDADGDEDDGLDECLVPYDFDNADYSSVILDDIFAYWIRNLQSEKILIVFDNCYSGGAAKQKGVSLPGAKGNIGKDDFTKDIFRELPRKGTSLLAASKADQVSFESTELKNGIFTRFLINSISIANDSDFNKSLSITELYNSTRQKTLNYSKKVFKKEQEPICINKIENNLELFYLLYESQITTGKGNLDSLLYVYRQETELSKKIETYKKIYNTDPNWLTYIFEMARLYDLNSEYLKAIEVYENFEVPNLIYGTVADLYKKNKDLESAIYYYNEHIKYNPKEYTSYNRLADIYLSKFDTITAIQHLNNSISNQPHQKEAYLTLFYLHLNLGNLNLTSKIINKSLSINPKDFETLYWYTKTQKFVLKLNIIDTLSNTIERNKWIRMKRDIYKNNHILKNYYMGGERISKKQAALYYIKDAIADYPYYDGFYLEYIKYVKDNKLDSDIANYIKKYLLFSKLNPDKAFIKEYIE